MQQSPKLVNKFIAFYGAQKFITMFTKTHNLPLSWAMSSVHAIQSYEYFLKIHFNIIPHLYLCLPGSHFPSGFSSKTLDMLLFYSVCATCPTNLIILIWSAWYLPQSTNHEAPCYIIFSSHLLLPPPLGPNIFLSTLFSQHPPPTFFP